MDWVCNECGSHEFACTISEADLIWLACSGCGCNEFHKEPSTDDQDFDEPTGCDWEDMDEDEREGWEDNLESAEFD